MPSSLFSSPSGNIPSAFSTKDPPHTRNVYAKSFPYPEQPDGNNNQSSRQYSRFSSSQVSGESATFSKSKPPLLFPNRRTPISAENGVALMADFGSAPLLWLLQRVFVIEPRQLEQLLQAILIVIEKLEPLLKLLGLHHSANNIFHLITETISGCLSSVSLGNV